MSMAREKLFICIGLMLFGLLINNVSVEGLAVNWGTIASHPLPPETVVKLLQEDGFDKVKLFDNNPNCLKALAGTGISAMIAIPNEDLQLMTDPANAKAWVAENVIKYSVTSKDGVNITYVGIGNEPFLRYYGNKFVNLTLPALMNIQQALNDVGIGDHVKATVPFNADVYYSPSWNPVPSAGIFRGEIADTMVQILDYLNKNNAPFVVNIYPFLSVYYGGGQFPIDFAFLDGKAAPLIDGSIEYTNVFDAMVDTLASALKLVGFQDMPIVIGEIGWPTDGDINANITMAQRFYNGLIPKVLSDKGTPLRPGHMDIYFFALYDEDLKSTLPGTFERSWGLYRYDGRPKFPLVISTNNGTNKTLASADDVGYLPKRWCTLRPDAYNVTAIRNAMNWACFRSDCTQLSNFSSCSNLNSNEQASYAYNSYYQVQNQNPSACDFGSLANITYQDPSKGSCNFTIEIALQSPAPAPALSPSSPSRGKSGGISPPSSSKTHSSTIASSPGLLPLVIAFITTFLG